MFEQVLELHTTVYLAASNPTEELIRAAEAQLNTMLSPFISDDPTDCYFRLSAEAQKVQFTEALLNCLTEEIRSVSYPLSSIYFALTWSQELAELLSPGALELERLYTLICAASCSCYDDTSVDFSLILANAKRHLALANPDLENDLDNLISQYREQFQMWHDENHPQPEIESDNESFDLGNLKAALSDIDPFRYPDNRSPVPINKGRSSLKRRDSDARRNSLHLDLNAATTIFRESPYNLELVSLTPMSQISEETTSSMDPSPNPFPFS